MNRTTFPKTISTLFLFSLQIIIFTFSAKASWLENNQESINNIPDANSTTPLALEIHETISSIGITAPYLGDDNQTNLATAYYRPTGTSEWLIAHPLSPDRGAREWRGSLVNLSSNTPYEIEVRYQDGDGVSPSTVSGSVQTRPNYPVIGTNGVIRTVTSQSNLQSVLDSAQPGDTVQLLSGIYNGDIFLKTENSGTPGHYITIEPAPGANVIFDGSDKEINGPIDQWTFYANSSKGPIYYTDLPWGDTQCSSDVIFPNYIGEQINGESIRYLLFDGGTQSWDQDFLPAPVGKAFYACSGSGPGPNGRLYVITYEGDDPDNHEMQISRYTTAFRLKGTDYIRIRGFEIRYYNTTGIRLYTDDTSGADNNIIENNTIYGIGKWHIRFNGIDGENWITDNLIQNNVIYERGYRDSHWQWEVEYHHGRGEAPLISLDTAGSGNVVRYNHLESGHDAIQVNHRTSDVDIHNNLIVECMDNAIEVDNDPGQNIRIWGNYVKDCYDSFSVQDWNGSSYGPVYLFRNVIDGGDDPQGRKDDLGGVTGYDGKRAFKVGSDIFPDGFVYIYHNTISIIRSQFGEGDGVTDAGGNYFANLTTRNNIWHVTGDVFHLSTPNTVVNHDVDCDNLHDLDPTSNYFIVWSDIGGPNGNGRYTNLADFQTATAQELNGISNTNTLFTTSFRLIPGSPDIDAGCLIPGFNDRGPYLYHDTAPDLGAFEYYYLPYSTFLPVIER